MLWPGGSRNGRRIRGQGRINREPPVESPPPLWVAGQTSRNSRRKGETRGSAAAEALVIPPAAPPAGIASKDAELRRVAARLSVPARRVKESLFALTAGGRDLGCRRRCRAALLAERVQRRLRPRRISVNARGWPEGQRSGRASPVRQHECHTRVVWLLESASPRAGTCTQHLVARASCACACACACDASSAAARATVCAAFCAASASASAVAAACTVQKTRLARQHKLCVCGGGGRWWWREVVVGGGGGGGGGGVWGGVGGWVGGGRGRTCVASSARAAASACSRAIACVRWRRRGGWGDGGASSGSGRKGECGRRRRRRRRRRRWWCGWVGGWGGSRLPCLLRRHVCRLRRFLSLLDARRRLAHRRRLRWWCAGGGCGGSGGGW